MGIGEDERAVSRDLLSAEVRHVFWQYVRAGFGEFRRGPRSLLAGASSLGGGMVGRGAGLLGGLCRGLHAGEVVGFGHGQPALGHFGLGVALGAVHDRGAMGLMAGGAFKLLVMGPVGVVGAHVGRKLVEVVAGEVVATLVQAQLVGLAEDLEPSA